MKRTLLSLAVAAILSTASLSGAATIEVNEFLPSTSSPASGKWYLTDIRGGGTATINNLTGVGGNLETNQPLPTGAAKLTTGLDDNDKAEVGTFANFGLASTLLEDIELGYDYYKQSVTGGNTAAAPSIKLTIAAQGGTGDNYGQLVYEPYWNLPGTGPGTPETGDWKSVSIDERTGWDGTDLDGGWWWTGGFGFPGSAGGDPLRSLEEWATGFAVEDGDDFANAYLIGISIGVGTYNQGQVGYFDNVSIRSTTGQLDITYDFEASEIPEPATLMLFGLGLVGIAGMSRRKH
ncbi:MAG: PEP-CTERM sorting domain-containing protein [Desulfobacterales bacterium]|nr:PEP-CTERM sorting domain-containing protein [Desulfobacterales bacterium]